MMNYTNLERNNKKFKINKIVIFIILLILSIIASIIYIYINNHNDNKSIRRKINIIEEDITNLYNYTETMSEFLIDDYKPSNNDLKIILKSINDFKNETYKNQMDLKKELIDLKNENLRIQMDLKKMIEINENRTKDFLRKKAIDFLKTLGLYKETSIYMLNPTPCLLNYNYDLDLNNLDKDYYFNELFKIDYDNFIVSFAYFSDDIKENIKLHPIYKLINQTLKFDYNYLYPLHKFDTEGRSPELYSLKDYYYINYMYQYYGRNTNYLYSLETVKDLIPYKEWMCISSVEYQRYYYNNYEYMFIKKINDEYEYINKIISFTTIRPIRFI